MLSLAPVGGPLGRHAAATWTAVVWPLVALTGLPVVVSMFQRAYCLQHGWDGQNMFWRACFSDVPVQYSAGSLGDGLAAYLSGASHLEQPIVTGSVMALLGGFVGDGSAVAQQRTYFILWTLLATVLLMATVWLTAATRPLHRVDAAQVALSPLIVLTLVVGPDIIGVALVAAAMWAWSRRHPTATGVLLGLAVMARTYPLLVVAALVLLALRAGRLRDLRRPLGACALTVAVVLGLGVAAGWGTLTAAYGTWSSAGAAFGSPWFIPQLAGHPLPAALVTTLSVLGMLLALGAGFVLALGAARRPTWAEVSLVMVGVVLVTGKSLPVQASLWLLPLAALAGVRWRDHFLWVGAEALHFVAVWLYIGGFTKPDRGLPPAWYTVFLLLRLAGILYLVWRVWHTAMARPAHDADPGWPEDPDRDEVVDEGAGALTGSPDRVVAAYT